MKTILGALICFVVMVVCMTISFKMVSQLWPGALAGGIFLWAWTVYDAYKVYRRKP